MSISCYLIHLPSRVLGNYWHLTDNSSRTGEAFGVHQNLVTCVWACVTTHCNCHDEKWLWVAPPSYQKLDTFISTPYHPPKSLSFPTTESWHSWYTLHLFCSSKHRTQLNLNDNRLPASLHQIHASGELLLQLPQDAAKTESKTEGYKCGPAPISTMWKDGGFSMAPNVRLYHGTFIVTTAFAPMKMKTRTLVSKCSFALSFSHNSSKQHLLLGACSVPIFVIIQRHWPLRSYMDSKTDLEKCIP